MFLRSLLILLICPLLMVSIGRAATLQVPTDYPTLAEAVVAAESGDTVILAPGVHTESGISLTKGVTLRGGGSSPSDTVLDAGGQGRIFLVDSLSDSTIISNLTLCNSASVGRASFEMSGGALFINQSPVRLENCIFTGNSADAHGGAIRISGASPLIRNCQFSNNEAPNGGGGAIEASFGSSPVIDGCEFENNFARWGGAVSVRMGGVVAITDSHLIDNVTDGDRGYGGAIFADNTSIVGVTSTVLAGNWARFGGAIACLGTAQTNLNHVTMTDNSAEVFGGGMLLKDASPQITNSIIAFNNGTGIGLSGASAPVVACSNLYGNTAGDWTSNLIAITDMDVNYEVDPLFLSRDPGSEDGLYLSPSSPLLSTEIECDIPGVFGGSNSISAAPEVLPGKPEITNFMASPNPFNPVTNIRFNLMQSEFVEVAIYGLRGDLVQVLARRVFGVGEQTLAWRGRDSADRNVSSGIYLVVIRSESQTRSLKVTLLK